MANTTLIKGNPEFTAYDTDSGDVSVTLSSVTGKTYQVFNKGTSGNKLTVTYGSDSMIFEDGDSGVLTYDGANWATQFSTVGGPVSLTPGRISDDERDYHALTTSGWWTFAESEAISYDVLSCTIRGTMIGGGAGHTATLNLEFTDSNTTKEDKSSFAYMTAPSYEGTPYVAYRYVYRTAVGGGVKLQVWAPPISVSFKGKLISNFSKDIPGMKLVTPYLDNSPNVPAGMAGTTKEAGAELSPISSGTFVDSRIMGYCASATSIRLTLLFPSIAKQNATTVTFPVAFNIRKTDGNIIYTVSTGETMAVNSITGNVVTALISTTGLTQNESGLAVGPNISAELS